MSRDTEGIKETIANWKKAKDEKKALRRRKNASNFHGILTEAQKAGIYKCGDIIDTADIAKMVGEERLEQWFKRDAKRKDGYGPTKSIGDVVGGHALKLQKTKPPKDRMYVFPLVLPVVDDHNNIWAEAIYPPEQ